MRRASTEASTSRHPWVRRSWRPRAARSASLEPRARRASRSASARRRLRHLLPPPLVAVGEGRHPGIAGDRIGAVGTTGTRSATAPHLHSESAAPAPATTTTTHGPPATTTTRSRTRATAPRHRSPRHSRRRRQQRPVVPPTPATGRPPSAHPRSASGPAPATGPAPAGGPHPRPHPAPVPRRAPHPGPGALPRRVGLGPRRPSRCTLRTRGASAAPGAHRRPAHGRDRSPRSGATALHADHPPRAARPHRPRPALGLPPRLGGRVRRPPPGRRSPGLAEEPGRAAGRSGPGRGARCPLPTGAEAVRGRRG